MALLLYGQKSWAAGPDPQLELTQFAYSELFNEPHIIKDLIPELTCQPKEALDKAVAIANRGDVSEVYVNADMEKLPRLGFAAVG